MKNTAACRWVTVKPLLFNNPNIGAVFEIPAGEPCLLLESPEEARKLGFITSDQEMWAAKTNIQRGYCLVWLRGMVRGIAKDDISRR